MTTEDQVGIDPLTNSPGLALVFDGAGGAKELPWEELDQWAPEDGFLWIHLDYKNERARDWVREQDHVDPVVAESLLAEETRPRCTEVDDSLLISLRAINMNPKADPEDMVSLRVWINKHRAITLRHRRLSSGRELQESLLRGLGPKTAGLFLCDLSSRVVARIAEIESEVSETVDDLEERLLTDREGSLLTNLGEVRRDLIHLRRYLSPQRDVLSRMAREQVGWLTEVDRARLREIGDSLTRVVEDLDASRDRAALAQEEIRTGQAEEMNGTMRVLSLVATIFLPLSLFTGLLGINVGGIPGSASPAGFAIVSGIIVALGVAMVVYFRRRRWL